jgi:periplasmic divalent cation tolerance protein
MLSLAPECPAVKERRCWRDVMADEIVILITASSDNEAANIARTLVDEHRVACVNVIKGVQSFFFWEGRTQESSESLLICKSRSSMIDGIMTRVKSLHSYTVPEIIALPIVAGLPAYLEWVRSSAKAR